LWRNPHQLQEGAAFDAALFTPVKYKIKNALDGAGSMNIP
jgi:hypothetical protein